MSWQQYVRQHAAGRSQSDLAAAVGVTPGTVSKWISGTQGIDAAKAISFARGVGDAPLAALIAGGFLTQAEAKSRPAAAPDYSQLSNDQLLDLIRDRMREDVRNDAEQRSSAATNRAPGSGVEDEQGVGDESLSVETEAGSD